MWMRFLEAEASWWPTLYWRQAWETRKTPRTSRKQKHPGACGSNTWSLWWPIVAKRATFQPGSPWRESPLSHVPAPIFLLPKTRARTKVSVPSPRKVVAPSRQNPKRPFQLQPQLARNFQLESGGIPSAWPLPHGVWNLRRPVRIRVKMIHPEPCKEFIRRPHPLLTFYLRVDCDLFLVGVRSRPVGFTLAASGKRR